MATSRTQRSTTKKCFHSFLSMMESLEIKSPMLGRLVCFQGIIRLDDLGRFECMAGCSVHTCIRSREKNARPIYGHGGCKPPGLRPFRSRCSVARSPSGFCSYHLCGSCCYSCGASPPHIEPGDSWYFKSLFFLLHHNQAYC